jgi:hypothetical protein
MSVILSDWDRVPMEPLLFVVCSMPTTVESPVSLPGKEPGFTRPYAENWECRLISGALA